MHQRTTTGSGDSTLAANRHAQRATIIRLAIAQALAGANSTVFYATGAVIGAILAPDKRLATLPISIFVVGMAICILPAGMITQHFGRRMTFFVGTACGTLAGLLGALAILQSSFWVFCLATLFGGAYAAVALSFRFAAADCVEADERPRALSIVMAGGVVAGVVGPQLVTYTMYLWQPYIFAATFIAQGLVAILSAIVLSGVELPKPIASEITGGRPLGEIAKQPRFLIAVTCGAVSYMLMNFLMTAAPLAMRMCGHNQETSNLGLQWHVIAMYGPSFFTGRLIARFGTLRVIAVGLALIGASAVTGLSSTNVTGFWLTLILLGAGWNFGFVGASAELLECHRPEEKTRVQTLNDFIVFGTMVVGSFASGSLLTSYGWNTVLWVSFAPLALAVTALAAASIRKPVTSRA